MRRTITVLITVMIALLAMVSSALAQDEFNVNTNPIPATCNPAYDAAMEKLAEQDAQAEGQLRKENVNCQSQSPSDDTVCKEAANKKFWAVHVEVLKGQIDADANQQICNNHVNLAAAAEFNAKNKPDPCQSQYDQTMGGLSDQETLAEAQLRKDDLDCQSQSDSTNCREAAQQKYSPVHKKIINGQTDANTNRTICEDRKTLAQSGTPVPTNPGGAEVPQVVPTPFTGLTGGAAKNVPAAGPAASPANGPASSDTPAKGIAEIPKLAPVEGPVPTPSPMRALTAGISKNEWRNPPKPIPQPPASNSIAKNQAANATLGPSGKANSNAGQIGPGGGPAARVPNDTPPVHGPLRFVREGADWVAKHLPGGESGVRAAADYSKQLKQPFEDRWTKPNGGIQEVGETVAGHGIGKVAGKLLGIVASKVAQSPLGRAILSRFPKARNVASAAAKDAGESSESAGNRAARNPQPPSRNSPPQRTGQGPQEQARDARGQPNGPGSSSNSNNGSSEQRMRQAENQRHSPQQQQARNRPQNSAGSNNSANSRAPQQQANRTGQNSPQQQARNDQRLQSGAGAIGGKSREFVPPRPTIKPTVVSDGFGGYKAYWGNDPKAFAMFRPEKGGVVVSDLFRGAQPSGSAGIMLADALRKEGLQRPASITFSNIIEERTLGELQAGMAPEETLLGKTLGNASKDLGARVVGWTTGVINGKPWMKGVLAYQ